LETNNNNNNIIGLPNQLVGNLGQGLVFNSKLSKKMKKLILSIGVIALTFGSILPANSICRDSSGQIIIRGGNTFSQDNGDGSCSGCNMTCARPLPQA
jgi:hypothetical protein